MSIPIYQLPKNALINVLRNMDGLSLIFISFNSKFSKSLIKSLGYLKSSRTTVVFSSERNIRIDLKHYDSINIIFEPIPSDIFDWSFITGKQLKERVVFIHRNKLFGKFFDHLIDILNEKIIDCLFEYRPTDPMEIQFIHDVLSNFKIESVVADFSDDDYIFEFFNLFPQTDGLVFEPFRTVNTDSPLYRKLFIQNLYYMRLGFYVPINLNTLLSMNTAIMELFYSTLTGKDINAFLKCWMKGSNPRLQFLYMDCAHICQKEAVMKNIPHRKVPWDEKRQFEVLFAPAMIHTGVIDLTEGIDIIRRDGTRATVLIEPDYCSFKMFVWP